VFGDWQPGHGGDLGRVVDRGGEDPWGATKCGLRRRGEGEKQGGRADRGTRRTEDAGGDAPGPATDVRPMDESRGDARFCGNTEEEPRFQ
jgi:hypothetical protein